MSDHHDLHADSHGHDDHGHHGDDRIYFDDTTNILAPILMVILLVVIFGVLFFG